MGSRRELKKAEEAYWKGTIDATTLQQRAREIRMYNWQLQQQAGLDFIPCTDFSFYDQVLDMVLTTGAIPERFHAFVETEQPAELDLYFALARGYQQAGYDLTAMEMTKWFDTNYHYLVPEFRRNQSFSLLSDRMVQQFHEARQAGFSAKPVLLGPVSFLLLGKEKEAGFHRLELLDNLLPVYLELLGKLEQRGATHIQLDEPCLTLNLSPDQQACYRKAYQQIHRHFPQLHLLLATYFGSCRDNLALAAALPVQTLHLDLVRGPEQLEEVLQAGLLRPDMNLSLGVVDGRNIWKSDFRQALALIARAQEVLGPERLWIAPSCSLLHVPCDLTLETDEQALPARMKDWMAFARQKVEEVVALAALSAPIPSEAAAAAQADNFRACAAKAAARELHRPEVQQRVAALQPADSWRKQPFAARKTAQQAALQLPAFPTTTIGSFPQTKQIRKWRRARKKGLLAAETYAQLLKEEIARAICWQESLQLDVLVHGEFERNDMVEYFGQQLEGFVITSNGWVQSYGSRCVKPPIIVGDVWRSRPLTLAYTTYAQSLTNKPVKGMLTGPVTILQWSFVRNDQPRKDTCMQLALAMGDEVKALEAAGIGIIQIDEPALREGLPLRKEDWQTYLDWAVMAFRVTASEVADTTQIHTHMCYSEFNDIIAAIADMDADVITIETSRSQMELLAVFADFRYPNDIGPGVYDIHAPRIPSEAEMVRLLEQAVRVIDPAQLWVNPDCGLKTRDWPETRAALENMMAAACHMRGRQQLTD